jgi:hypothetical protein
MNLSEKIQWLRYFENVKGRVQLILNTSKEDETKAALVDVFNQVETLVKLLNIESELGNDRT